MGLKYRVSESAGGSLVPKRVSFGVRDEGPVERRQLDRRRRASSELDALRGAKLRARRQQRERVRTPRGLSGCAHPSGSELKPRLRGD